jgi:hypothetical protein
MKIIYNNLVSQVRELDKNKEKPLNASLAN